MLGITETIAFEGPVCAGKTTLIKNLVCFGYQMVPEYVDFAQENNLKLPKFPPKNVTEAKSAFEFYLDLESRRQYGVKPGKWLLDRSKYTLLAFEAGARQLTQIDIFDWARNQVKEHQSEIIDPCTILYIDIDSRESRRRATLSHMGTPDFLFSTQFTNGFKEAFMLFSSLNPNRFTFIDGSRPYLEVLAEVSRRIRFNAGISPIPASIFR